MMSLLALGQCLASVTRLGSARFYDISTSGISFLPEKNTVYQVSSIDEITQEKVDRGACQCPRLRETRNVSHCFPGRIYPVKFALPQHVESK